MSSPTLFSLSLTSLFAVTLPKYLASDLRMKHIAQESMDSSEDEFFDAQG